MERESIDFDILIVGAGPAGLSAACRLKQIAAAQGEELSVCVLEKGSEVGAHILSGALFETQALDELFPNWQIDGAPIKMVVKDEQLCYLNSETRALTLPDALVPRPLRNRNNYVISLANLCRWLGQQAETLGVDIFPSFAGAEILYSDSGAVAGVITGDMGVDKHDKPKPGFQMGMEIRAKYTIFAEGCHGHLGKQLIDRFDLRKNTDPQHYGLGIKEIWTINPAKHNPGMIVHTFGWPLDRKTEGGGFLYHIENNQIAIGFILALDYTNPHISPFDEMQRWKQHPKIKHFLEGGTRIGYGARAVNKGGLQSLPQLSFPGGVLVGCEAGTLNAAKVRGVHNAMKTGMLAAETIAETITQGKGGGLVLKDFDQRFKTSWVYKELHKTRNVAPLIKRFGNLAGGALAWLDQNILMGKLPFTLHNHKPDYANLRLAAECKKIDYPRHDGKISFDILSSVALSGTNHEENQPCHLQLANPIIPITQNLLLFGEPAQRYCPAKVYEIVKLSNGTTMMQINAQNCLHCKTCDIKDPAQNINWQVPEGGGGPNYANM